MNVLHIYKSYYPDTFGGVEKFIETLSSATTPFRVNHQLLTTTKNKKTYSEQRKSLLVHYFPATFEFSSCPVSFSLFQKIKDYAKAADLIHYHFPWPFADFLQLTQRFGKPFIVTYHSDVIRQKILNIPYQLLMQRFLKQAHVIVPTSSNYLNTSKVLKHYHDKCHVIPMGLDEKEYLDINSEKIAFWKNKVGESFFLFLGVLRQYKGLEYLLDAVATTNIPLVIAGSGPQEQQLKTQATDLKLKNVRFIGRVDEQDKSALYQLCRAVVIPSHLRSEAYCLTLVEGLMFGKPLISTEIGTGTSFVNQHNETGFVVAPQNPLQLREALQQLQNDEALCQQFGQAARKRYEVFFTAERMAKLYFELYKKFGIISH